MGSRGNGLVDGGKGLLGANLHMKTMRGVLLEKGGFRVAHGGGGAEQRLVFGPTRRKLGGRRPSGCTCMLSGCGEKRGLVGAVCSLAGTVVVSAEAGPGVAEALVAGPDVSGVRLHKYSILTEEEWGQERPVQGCWVSYYKL